MKVSNDNPLASLIGPLVFVLAGGVLLAPAAGSQESSRYSYFSAVDGAATLIQAGTGSRSQAEVNLPLLVGDRLWVARDSRLEIVLSDFNRLRLDSDSEVLFEGLAFSPNQAEEVDEATVLRLVEGRLQLVVVEGSAGETLPRIDTANATIYIQNAGTYVVSTQRDGWTQVVVRNGFAEVITERGSTVVRGQEEAAVEGQQWPQVRILNAAYEDSFELWAQDREERLASRETPYVDDSLQYGSRSLEEHGEWVDVDDTPAWRPYVDSGWRPYWHGRWVYTPSGLTWVSTEPWGWVPYHYGSWNHHHRYGWLWYPGSVYAPAHVYWYWGPSHVAWIPSGYYTHHYGHRYGHYGFGFRFGVYGYAGGSWDLFRRWVFCPTYYFGHHHQYRHHHYGGWGGVTRTANVPRGIITTDTRRLTPDRWQRPDRVQEVLVGTVRGAPGSGSRQDLPDVTSFLARQPKLDPTIEDWLLVRRTGRSPSVPDTRTVTRTDSQSPVRPTRRLGGDGEGETRTVSGPRRAGEGLSPTTGGTPTRRPDVSGDDPQRLSTQRQTPRAGEAGAGRVLERGDVAGAPRRGQEETPTAVDDVLRRRVPHRPATPERPERLGGAPRAPHPTARPGSGLQDSTPQRRPRVERPESARPAPTPRSGSPEARRPPEAGSAAPSPGLRSLSDPSPQRPRAREAQRPGTSRGSGTSRGVSRRLVEEIRGRSVPRSGGSGSDRGSSSSVRSRPSSPSTSSRGPSRGSSRVSPQPPSPRRPSSGVSRSPSSSRTRGTTRPGVSRPGTSGSSSRSRLSSPGSTRPSGSARSSPRPSSRPRSTGARSSGSRSGSSGTRSSGSRSRSVSRSRDG